MAKRKPAANKILDYFSKPRSGEWTSARYLSRYLKEPLEHIEFFICDLTDKGLLEGIRDKNTGEYWVFNLWQKKED